MWSGNILFENFLRLAKDHEREAWWKFCYGTFLQIYKYHINIFKIKRVYSIWYDWKIKMYSICAAAMFCILKDILRKDKHPGLQLCSICLIYSFLDEYSFNRFLCLHKIWVIWNLILRISFYTRRDLMIVEV